MKRLLITENEKKDILSLYGLLNEQFKFKEVEKSKSPIKNETTDGLVIFKGASSRYVLDIKVSGEDVENNIIKQSRNEEKNEFYFYLKPNIDFVFEIKIKELGKAIKNDEPLKVPIKFTNPKDTKFYLIYQDKDSGTLSYYFPESYIPGSTGDPKIWRLTEELENLGYPTSIFDGSVGDYIQRLFGFGSSVYAGSINNTTETTPRPEGIITPYDFTVFSATDKKPLGFYIISKLENVAPQSKLENFWDNLGYKKLNNTEYIINIDEIDKFVNDLKTFLKTYPPEQKRTSEPISRP